VPAEQRSQSLDYLKLSCEGFEPLNHRSLSAIRRGLYATMYCYRFIPTRMVNVVVEMERPVTISSHSLESVNTDTFRMAILGLMTS
jgi:hypothetical protein